MTKISYIGKGLLIESAGNDKKKAVGKRILVIGDLHFGYGESMRLSGIMIPDNLYKELIKEMDEIFEHVTKNYGKIGEVVLLGDLKHEFGKIMRSEWKEVSDFLDYLNEKLNGKGDRKGKEGERGGKIVIIKGNHDTITGVVSGKKGLEIVDYYISDEIAFVHGDRKLEGSEIYNPGIKYWIMGHGHPAVRISDGTKEEKYKCFLSGKYKIRKEEAGKKDNWGERNIVIVPSFFSVNEGTDARDYGLGLAWSFDLPGFNVKVVNEGENGLEALDFGKLRNI